MISLFCSFVKITFTSVFHFMYPVYPITAGYYSHAKAGYFQARKVGWATKLKQKYKVSLRQIIG